MGYVEYSSRPARYRICKADRYLSHFNSPQDIIGVAAPQHGSFVALTKEEYERLDNYWRQYDSVVTRNPALPEFHADPEILFSDGKYYIYSTTDGFPQWGGTFFTCYSSADMKNWTYEGVPFDVTCDTRWAKGNAWAPAAVEKNGNTTSIIVPTTEAERPSVWLLPTGLTEGSPTAGILLSPPILRGTVAVMSLTSMCSPMTTVRVISIGATVSWLLPNSTAI